MFFVQNDAMFINFDISLEDIIRHSNKRKHHIIFTPWAPYIFCDVTVLIRNSPEVYDKLIVFEFNLI
jgi:hypothetical protein